MRVYEALALKIEYNGRAEISIREDRLETPGVIVTIRMVDWDAQNPGGDEVNLRNERILTELELDMMSLKTFSVWLRKFVHEWEVHEADEWLKINGRQIYDPHKKRYSWE